MPGLSSDPAKRRRQLEALARGSEKRAATLRARLDELDNPSPAPAPASEAPSGAASEAHGRVQAGRYSDAPSAAASEAQPELEPAPHDAPLEPEPAPQDAPHDAPHEPGRGLSIAAKLLGVDR